MRRKHEQENYSELTNNVALPGQWRCAVSKTEVISETADTYKHPRFTKKFKLAGLYVWLELTRNGSSLSGVIYRDGGVPDRQVKGTVDPKGVVTVIEYDESGKEDLIWKGRFYGTNRFSGVSKSALGSAPFTFVEERRKD